MADDVKNFKHQTGSIDFPARILNAAEVCSGEPTRFLVDGVLVQTVGNGHLIHAVATDTRCLIRVAWANGLYDSPVATIIPARIAKPAIKLAKKEETGEAMATLVVGKEQCELSVMGIYGKVIFQWPRLDGQFPDYQAVIPDFDKSDGISRIGINSDLAENMLSTMQKVVGDSVAIRLYLPSEETRPLGMEASDGDTVSATAVIMPVKIDEWSEKPPKVKPDDSATIPNAEGATPRISKEIKQAMARMVTGVGKDIDAIDITSNDGTTVHIGPKEAENIRRAANKPDPDLVPLSKAMKR